MKGYVDISLSLKVFCNKDISVTAKGVYAVYRLIQKVEEGWCPLPSLRDIQRYSGDDEESLVAAIEELKAAGIFEEREVFVEDEGARYE